MARIASALMVCVVATSLAAPASAQRRELQEARQAYAEGDYARVRTLLHPMVGGSVASIEDPLLVSDARTYLGAAYVLLEEPEPARRQFEWLVAGQSLEELERAELEPTIFFAQVRVLYDEIRAARIAVLRGELQAIEDQVTAREARRRAAARELLRLARSVEVQTEVDPLPTYVPLGIGQFTNGDDELGWFFAVTEGLMLLTAGVSMSTWIALDYQNQQAEAGVPGVRPVDTFFLEALIVTQLTSAAAFVVLAIAGVIESRLSFVPTRTRRVEQEIPRELLEELDLTLTPGGVSLRGRF